MQIVICFALFSALRILLYVESGLYSIVGAKRIIGIIRGEGKSLDLAVWWLS